MKKIVTKTALLVLLLISFALFVSCEKQYVYHPKQKIKRIYKEVPNYFPKYLSQEWTWEKNKLIKIDYYYYDNFRFSENYYYEGDKLVKVADEEGYFQIAYNGSKNTNIQYFRDDGKLLAVWDFSYSNNKVSKIIFSGDYMNEICCKNIESGFVSTFIPKEIISVIAERNTNRNSAKSPAQDIRTLFFTYDGDNIKEIKMELIEEGEPFYMTYTYNSYDKMLNPFYKHIGMNEYESDLVGTSFHLVTSKNNALEMIFSVPNEFIDKTTTTYTYNKKFPVEVEINRSITDNSETYPFPISKIYYEYE
jgi:hypothetical protein